MGLKVYAFPCGWLTVPRPLLLQGQSGSLTVPVSVYLIERPKGCALLKEQREHRAQLPKVVVVGGRLAVLDLVTS